MKANNQESSLAAAELRIADCARRHDKRLDLSSLGLRSLPPLLQGITGLTTLDLRHNELIEIPAWIGNLANLCSLYMDNNPLRRIAPHFSRLKQLKHLTLNGGSADVVNRTIGFLPNLEELRLKNLGLMQIPECLRSLRKLRKLGLDYNNIELIPPWLKELSYLQELSLVHNRLQRLPPALHQLPTLEELFIEKNPDLTIPEEIVASNNARKILDYYFRTTGSGQRQPLNEFKLVLVGRGGVGKTTLVHRLVMDAYKTFKRTQGIRITKWQVAIDEADVRAHIWDFGGQEIMHGTHRFFMTERALYVVVISGREGTEDHDAEYWLSLVRSFAGDVPIIVLLHKWTEYSFELNRELLREKYGRNLVFLETDSEDGQGIAQLRVQMLAALRTRLQSGEDRT